MVKVKEAGGGKGVEMWIAMQKEKIVFQNKILIKKKEGKEYLISIFKLANVSF